MLGCRNESKAKAAKEELDAAVADAKASCEIEILLVDVSDLNSSRKAAENLSEAVDGLVMNAGGMMGTTAGDIKEEYGVMNTVAANVLGHVVLFDTLVAAGKLKAGAIYAGSEVARGIPGFVKKPQMETGSIDEFASICDGSFFGENRDVASTYSMTKYLGTLWMSAMARKHPNLRCVTVSPGQTHGTNLYEDSSPFLKFVMTKIANPIQALLGASHSVEVGAKRYVDVLMDEKSEAYKNGACYASAKGAAGPMSDQTSFTEDFQNEEFQDHANEALHRFIK